MVGREVNTLFPKTIVPIGEPVLEVSHLTRAGVFSDVSFTVRQGEIVALAGLVGAGRSEVARAIFGVDPYTSGTVTVRGKKLSSHSTTTAMAAGIALVPEDRRRQGLIMNASVATNVTDAIRQTLTRLGIVTKRTENSFAQGWARRLEVKTASLDAVAATLSGGNQQKVVLAKWLASNPKVLIIDEPTRGIDVGTKAEVHKMMCQLAGQGMAILMISSELPEVLGMADRVLVMREGRLTAEIPRDKATPETVMFAATHTAEEVA
jgi:rhamnose transport system ATP-binding protein